MAKKVQVEVKVLVTMTVDEGIEVSDVVNEMHYEFIDTTTRAAIEDTEILDYDIVDSN